MGHGDRSSPSIRLHYLDNIRSVIIVFVVLFHAILPYSGVCPWWYVIDPQSIWWAILFMVFLEPILMPILFFISGLLIRSSYERQGPARFMGLKVRRLLVPFVLCTFLFSPIMPFIRHRLRSADSGAGPQGFWASWLDFLRSGSELYVGLPGVSEILVVNQYWFLMLLFVFCSGFWLYRQIRGEGALGRPETRAARPPSRGPMLLSVAGFGLAVAAVYALACTVIDGNYWVTLGGLLQIQPSKVPIYLGFFLAGIHVERRGWMPRILDLGRPALWLAAGSVMTAAYFAAVLTSISVENPSPYLVLASRVLRILLLLSVTLWSLTFFHDRLNRRTPLWREASASSYDIYLIHMVPQVVLQWLALSWPVPAPLKFAGVSALTLIVSYLVSRFVVRRSTPGTVLGLVLLFIVMGFVFR
jgi:fucose 4-O-acetylase-like acetyltransferase